jgi:hypothetical protein
LYRLLLFDENLGVHLLLEVLPLRQILLGRRIWLWISTHGWWLLLLLLMLLLMLLLPQLFAHPSSCRHWRHWRLCSDTSTTSSIYGTMHGKTIMPRLHLLVVGKYRHVQALCWPVADHTWLTIVDDQ